MLARQLGTFRGTGVLHSRHHDNRIHLLQQQRHDAGFSWRYGIGICQPASSGRPALHTCSAAAAAAGPLPGSGDDNHGHESGGFRSGLGGLGLGPAGYERTAAQRHQQELHTLNVAIVVNVLIFGAKLWAHFMSGSSSMLAEAMHSVADVLNQMLLRIGLLKAQKGPTEMHPYGYARDRFVWSLISAVGIFFLGAGASFIHGLHTLMEHRELEHMALSYGVLLLSGLLEGYSLWVATRVVVSGAAARRVGVLQYIRSGMDPTTVAVMMEDGGAVLGLVVAGACTALAHATGNAMWDAAGSILVGCLLGAIATFLVQKNRQLLIGRSMAPADVAAVQSLISADPVVAYVTDTKTEEIGPAMYRFKAEVAWDGEQLAKRYLDRCGRERLISRLQSAARAGDRAALEALIAAYGRDLISAVGAEVDRIESDIQRMNPGILYVDLETDRGRHDPWRRGAAALGIAGTGVEGAVGGTGLSSMEDDMCSAAGVLDEGPWEEAQRPAGAVQGLGQEAESSGSEQRTQGLRQQQQATAAEEGDIDGHPGGGGRKALELDLNADRWGGGGEGGAVVGEAAAGVGPSDGGCTGGDGGGTRHGGDGHHAAAVDEAGRAAATVGSGAVVGSSVPPALTSPNRPAGGSQQLTASQRSQPP